MRILLLLVIQIGLLSFSKSLAQEQPFEWRFPSGKTEGILLLFPGFGGDSNTILQEFKILDKAQDEGILLILMNINQRLWLEEFEKQDLRNSLETFFSNEVLTDCWFGIGGFSSGGNLAFQLGEFLKRDQFQ